MTSLSYPKAKHSRALTPPQYKNYGTYKRFLQFEFKRTCVYCRTSDTMAVGVVFGADHYRPKSLKQFKHLGVSYSNLYYCCSACNSRKNNFWPGPPLAVDVFIPNPCEHEMYKHLRFKGAVVVPVSKAGIFTEKKLDLNDGVTVAFRESVLHMISVLESEEARLIKADLKLQKKVKVGTCSAAQAAVMSAKIETLLDKTRDALHRQRGTLPLKKPVYRTPRVKVAP